MLEIFMAQTAAIIFWHLLLQIAQYFIKTSHNELFNKLPGVLTYEKGIFPYIFDIRFIKEIMKNVFKLRSTRYQYLWSIFLVDILMISNW